MPLVPGARLGPYEIASPLGAGGMGEVYRAHDTKLGRDVALKILPDAFATDPERLARFDREAQLLAALNHPNIATIHGFEQGPDGTHALVLELVDGPTLADRIAEGPMPLVEALPLAQQIAAALAAAHDQGIVHRDLKPANVKIGVDGAVKVLDFGLAKLTQPADRPSAGSALSLSPTITSPALMTGVGMLLGTAAYMSPEQAKGRAVDKRSDVWAFGCVLYEMLTGRRAFEGDDVTETLARIMLKEPEWDRLPAAMPANVVRVLKGCLERDLRVRFGSMAVPLFLLAESAPAQTRDRVAPRWSRAGAAAAAILIAALTGAAAGWVWTRPAPPAVVRTEITTRDALALSIGGGDRDIAITPDASHVVYRGANQQLIVRALDRLQPTVIGGVGAVRGLFISPDGQWIGFSADGALKKVAITGGPPVTISALDGAPPRGATWGEDGTIIFATADSGTGLQRVPASGGEAVVLTKPDTAKSEGDHFWPELLPGGRAVLFTITGGGATTESGQIAVLDLDTAVYKVVVRGGSHAHYVPTGHLVYGVNGTLRAVPFDLDRLEVTGTPAPVLEGVVTTGTGALDAVVSGNGTLVYVPGTGTTAVERTLVWVDRTGREEPLPAPPRGYFLARLSPDGGRLALDVRDQQFDIWTWDFARQTLTRLTFDASRDEHPVWTPDGRRIIFNSARGGPFNLYWQAADGTGSAERLIEDPSPQRPFTVTPDGSGLIAGELQGPATEIFLLPLRAPRTPKPLLPPPFNKLNVEMSPNGRWLAVQSNQSGQSEIYVHPFPDVGGGRWQISTAGGSMPLWSRDGRELFYRSTADGTIMGVRVDAGATTWQSTTPTRILAGRYFFPGGTNGRTYDVSLDGRRFLLLKERGLDNPDGAQNIVVTQNWTEELRRLVPAN